MQNSARNVQYEHLEYDIGKMHRGDEPTSVSCIFYSENRSECVRGRKVCYANFNELGNSWWVTPSGDLFLRIYVILLYFLYRKAVM